MEVGIVGLPAVGKTCLFNALTSGTVAVSQSAAKPNVGMAAVPDERLAQINQYIETQKIVHATVKFVDIAGLSKSADGGAGGLGNKVLAFIREADAILEVVRCFESADVPHVDGSVDPVRDVETVELELVLADLETAEKNIEKQRKHARAQDKEAIANVATLEHVIPELQKGIPIRRMGLKPEQMRFIKTLGLVCDKRVLYIANVGEDDLEGHSAHAQKLREKVASIGGLVVPVCAKLEAELMELPPEDRAAMLKEMGVKSPALETVTKAAYQLLGLQSFFTVGPDEIRAWPIPVGSHAPQAAGVIHTDFEKGFIRAEVYHLKDLLELKSEAAVKHAGRIRAEGKNYVFQEADIANFLFHKT